MSLTLIALGVVALVGVPVALYAYFGFYWEELRELNRKD